MVMVEGVDIEWFLLNPPEQAALAVRWEGWGARVDATDGGVEEDGLHVHR